jgi:hypothetical protein
MLHGPDSAPNFKRGGAYVLHRRCGKTVGEINKHVRFATDNELEARRLKICSRSSPTATSASCSTAQLRPHLPGAQAGQGGRVAAAEGRPAAGIVGSTKNETELSVTLPGYVDPTKSVGADGAHAPAILPPAPHTIRLWGGDNADALRGVKLSGAAYDEYQDHNPYLHNAVVSKSLADHLGYHDYLGTVKGKNQLYQAWKAAQKEPETWTRSGRTSTSRWPPSAARRCSR